MEKRLTQEEEKGPGDSDGEEAGNLPPALKPVLYDLKFVIKFCIF